MDKLKKLLNRETVMYLVFGVATTLVNYIVFWMLYSVVFGQQNSLAANTVAFVAAVIFAFVVNKTYVFESKSWSTEALKKEVPSFLAARVGSFLIEEAGLLVCERILKWNGVILFRVMNIDVDGIAFAKIVLSFVVVVINYVLCKFFVFKKLI